MIKVLNMSWSIANVVNEVKVSKKCAQELFDTQKYEGEICDNIEDVVYKGRLNFNSDHMEHMDYIGNNDAVCRILLKYKVKGDICFGSLEGDNAGSFWGYRFDGNGGMSVLEGKLEWYMKAEEKSK